MRTKSILTLALVAAAFTFTGCNKDKAEGGDKAKAEKAEDKPSLMLSNDTPACRKALKCCEEMVKLNNGGKATPENINLSCSGVGIAADDKGCGEFQKGYVMAIEGKGKPVPATCK